MLNNYYLIRNKKKVISRIYSYISDFMKLLYNKIAIIIFFPQNIIG